MTVIGALRTRLPECSSVSDEEILRTTKGTFIRLGADFDVLMFELAKVFPSKQQIVSALKRLTGR